MPRVILLALLAFPGLVSATSFDCAKAASLPEMMICNDPELSKLDDELGVIQQRVKSKAPDLKAFNQQTQAAWKWREAYCQTRECLMTWYAQRKTTLLKIAEPPGSPGSSKCLAAGPVRLSGFIVSQSITLEPDGRQSMVYLLNTKDPICVRIAPTEAGEARDMLTNRFQLLSQSGDAMSRKVQQYLFKKVTIGGVLLTDNLGQYYAESNAIDVKSVEPSP